MSEFLTQFHFLRPLWLLAFVPIGVFCVWLFKHQASANQWSKYINPRLLTHLLDKKQVKQNRWPLWCALGLWAWACVALAGPTWQQLPQPIQQTNEALVLCWDLSPSMLAQDVKPSRLDRARLKIIDLLKSRNEGLFALVAYSGEAYTVTPLTDDVQTIINLLPALSPAHLPTVGSNPEMALDNAQQLLRDAGAARGNIVFITDGIAQNAHDYLTRQAKKSPYKLTLWPVGTEEGAPIPLPNGGFAKDNSGNIVVPKLDQGSLQTLASQMNAYYVPMVTRDSDLKTINQLLQPQGGDISASERNFDQWFEQGQILALILLPFLALLFRSGWVFCLTITVSLLYSPSSEANIWHDLWQTQDQQAQKQLDLGDAEAAKNFSTPERRGSALYQQEQYQGAASEFAKTENQNGLFNRGTALTQAGKYQQALDSFDKALKIDPNFIAASTNRALAQQLLDLQKQQEEQEKQQGQSDDQNSENQDSEGQDQDSQDSQSGDQQPQDSSEQGSEGEQGQQQAGDPNQEQQQNPQGSSSEDSGEPQSEEANPYADVKPEGDQKAQEQQIQQGQEGDDAEQPQEKNMALTGASAGDKTEQEQQLEMMLRKVPDDPGGLLRQKFRYQYRQRKQDPTRTMTDNEAENRW